MANILLADDEESVRTFVARALEHKGHQVTKVADGGEALEALASDRFDLLLTDIVMPVMDGVALALKASGDYPDMPVLMMTGYASEKQRAHNLDRIIQGVISKPFSLEDITSAVDKALRGEDI